MAYDEKTPHLSLPLPHPRNTLREDCPRIRESLQALDRFAEKSDAAVAALAEADTTLANAMQSQGKDLPVLCPWQMPRTSHAIPSIHNHYLGGYPHARCYGCPRR